jgi:ATP phosphoribosyltransferase regulatory subunit
MTVFKTIDASSLTVLEALGHAILSLFENAGFVRVEPSILQPADVFLDRSGEEIRRRTYVFTDPGGEELCLRPDLTIPTLRAYLEHEPLSARPARFSYHGPVFRYQPLAPDRPQQFLQAGGEIIGGSNGPADDAEIMTLAVNAVAGSGLKTFRLKMGDLALFSALVDALALAPPLAARLKRHFWRPDYFRDLLKQLQEGGAPGGALAQTIGGLGPQEARAVLRDVFAVAGVQPQGARTAEEIAERFLEKAADARAARLPRAAADLLTRFLDIETALNHGVEAMRALTGAAGISIEPTLCAMEQRLTLLQARGFRTDKAVFSAQFGRNMEYYTGFVFELWARDAQGEVQIAGGGRYDNLARGLGAVLDTPAVGCAVRTERLQGVLAAAGAGP